MSGSSAWLRRTVLERLQADEGVKSFLGDPARVFSSNRGGAAYPHLRIARSEMRPLDSAEAPASEERIDLALVSTEDYAGLADALAAVRAALEGWRPAGDSWRCVTFAPVFSDMLAAPGRLQRAILRIRAVTEPV